MNDFKNFTGLYIEPYTDYVTFYFLDEGFPKNRINLKWEKLEELKNNATQKAPFVVMKIEEKTEC